MENLSKKRLMELAEIKFLKEGVSNEIFQATKEMLLKAKHYGSDDMIYDALEAVAGFSNDSYYSGWSDEDFKRLFSILRMDKEFQQALSQRK